MTPSILIVITRVHTFCTRPFRALTAQCLSFVCVFISCWGRKGKGEGEGEGEGLNKSML